MIKVKVPSLELFIGIIGAIILQAQNVPYIIDVLFNNVMVSNIVPTIQVFVGLSCYLYFSIKRKVVFYTITNVIGMILSAILILLYFIR